MNIRKQIFQGNFSYHLLVWILLITPTVFGSAFLMKISVWTYILNLIVANGLLLSVVYFNYLFLIPGVFRKGKYFQFALHTILLILAVTAMNNLLDHHNHKVMGWRPMSFSDELFETSFYLFKIGTYILTSFLLFSVQEKQHQKMKLDQVQVEKLGTEIKYLRAQINPHFLFNTLNNLYGLTLEKSDKTPEIILKLSKIMDYMLYESNELKVYLKKDIENINNYIDIERIRQGNNAVINFEVKGNITNQKIVPLTLLPLVENAFKHGINTIIRDAYMQVLIYVNHEDLEIDVRNNFKKTNVEEDRNGIGLKNLQQRLDLFYPNAHTMKADAFDDDYHVNLKLKLS